ncbi:repeat protein, partial [mine drainage metagenome]
DTLGANMNDRIIGHMLRDLGTERFTITEFLSNFTNGSGYLAVDLTHVFSLSDNMVSSMIGYNSKKDYAPQVNLLYLFSLTRKIPVYFRTLIGSISSVSSLVLSIKESGVKDVVLVGDKGFYSDNNVTELEKQGKEIHYILPLKRDSSLVSYDVIRSGDMRKFTGHFVFEKRPIHYYSYDAASRKVFVFLDEKLKTEEMKDAIQRSSDENKSEDE